MTALLDVLFRFAAFHPRAAIGLVAAVTVALGAGLPRLRTDFDIEQIFPVDDPERAAYEEYRRHFGRDDATGLVAIRETTGNPRGVFTAGTLAAIDRLTREAERWPEVKQVRSVTNARTPVAEGDAIEVRRIVRALPAPGDAAELDRIRRAFLDEPIFHHALVSRQGDVAVTAIELAPAFSGFEGRESLLARLEALAPELEAGGEREVILHGMPLARARYRAVLARNQRTLFPVALLFMCAFLYAAFRRARSVLLPLAILALSCAWVYGALGWLGLTLNFVTTLVPVVIMIVGVTDLVHLLLEPGPMLETMRRIGVACFMTCFVAAVGFADLVLTNVVAIEEFGVACAAGMISTFLIEALLLPALVPAGNPRREGAAEQPPDRLDALLCRVAGAVPARSKVALIAATALLVAGAAGLPRLRVDAKTYDYLADTHPIVRAERFFEERLGGVLPIAVWLDTGRQDGALAREAVETSARIARRLASLPHVRVTRSLADHMAVVHRLWVDDAPPGALPATDAEVAQEFLQYEGARDHPVHRLLDEGRRRMQVVARIDDVGTAAVIETVAAIDRFLAEEVRPRFPGARATGMAYVAQRANHAIAWNLVLGFALSFAISFAALALLFRSPSVAGVAMLPNVLPVVLVFGAIGFSGAPLKATTAMVCSIAFGIAIDDTIHYLARCRDARAAGASHAEAARRAVLESGRGMILSSVVLSAGFGIFVLSEFEGDRAFGALTALTLVLAMAVELTVTPALVAILRPDFRVGSPPAAEP